MKVIRDADTTEFIDGEGDRLFLLIAPRQRDVDRSNEIERSYAFKQMKMLKDAGIDADKAMEDAQKEETKPEPSELAPPARLHRLSALAHKMIIGGESIGGKAITEAYLDMDPASAKWVDECVESIWKAATVDDAERDRKSADSAVPAVEGSITAEGSFNAESARGCDAEPVLDV